MKTSRNNPNSIQLTAYSLPRRVFIGLIAVTLMVPLLFTTPASAAVAADDSQLGSIAYDSILDLTRDPANSRVIGRSAVLSQRTAWGFENWEEGDFTFYQFGVATKLDLLMENIWPLSRLNEEIAFLDKWTQIDALKTCFHSGQERSIWDMLSVQTQRRINGLTSAYEAMMIVKESSEYQQNAELKRFADIYLEQTIGGESIRSVLSRIVSPVVLENLTPDDLIAFARPIAASEEYRALMFAIQPLWKQYGSQVGYAKMDSQRLEEIYAEISQASKAFWPNLAASIDNYMFIDPVIVPLPQVGH